MTKYNKTIFFLSLIIVNSNLYLALNIDDLFFYPLISVFFTMIYIIILKLRKPNNSNFEEINITSTKQQEDSAENHPIIQSARKRLGK